MSLGGNDRIAVTLRLLAGVYLAYTAWDLRDYISQGWLYIIPLVLFAIIGLVLVGFSVWQLSQLKKAAKAEAEAEAKEE